MLYTIEKVTIFKSKIILTILKQEYTIDEFYYQVLMPYENKKIEESTFFALTSFASAYPILKYQYTKIFNHSITKKELYLKLKEKEIESNQIQCILSILQKEGYLKEEDFIMHYKEQYQLNKGVYAFEQFLQSKGVDAHQISLSLLDYQENEQFALALANRYIKQTKESKKKLEQKIKIGLYNKGFSKKTITTIFSLITLPDDLEPLKKDYAILKKKYGEEPYKILSKLRNKGYNMNAIKKVMTEVDIYDEDC